MRGNHLLSEDRVIPFVLLPEKLSEGRYFGYILLMNQLCFHAGTALRSLLCSIKDKCKIRIINCINVQKQTDRSQYDLEGVHRKRKGIILTLFHIINFCVQVYSPLKVFIIYQANVLHSSHIESENTHLLISFSCIVLPCLHL